MFGLELVIGYLVVKFLDKKADYRPPVGKDKKRYM